jgi:hypothetical protein
MSSGPVVIDPSPIAPGSALYRETDVDGLSDLLYDDSRQVVRRMFVSDSRDLAIGQGGNVGVQIEFRPDSLSGAEHKKPGTGERTGREYQTDMVGPRAIQAFVAPSSFSAASLRGLARRALSEFSKETLPDGRVRYTRRVTEGSPKGLVDPETLRESATAAAPPQSPVTFTRRGDFWNYAGPRAKEIAKALELTVTTDRATGAPAVAIPEHARQPLAAKLDDIGMAANFAGLSDATASDDASTSDAPMAARTSVTDTPEFKRWFGDSKVVDADGKPLVVYHGSPDLRFMREDAIFKPEKERIGFGRAEGAFWFTPSQTTAKTYADPRRAFDYQNAEEGIVAAYIKLENPLVIDAAGQNWRDAQRRGKTSDVIAEARKAGHDGVVIRNVKDNYNNDKNTKPTDTYVVFDSKQIKSAIGNRGTFNPNDGNIMAARSGSVRRENRLAATFSTIASFDEAFQRPVSASTDPASIAEDIAGADFSVRQLNADMPAEWADQGAPLVWEIFPPKSTVRSGKLFDDGKSVWLDVGHLLPGVDEGNAFYEIAATYAHNNGRVFIGDPRGLSPKAFFRRLENMISSALKFGTTDHLRPHEGQVNPGEYFRTKAPERNEAFAAEVADLALDWKPGDTAHNLKSMLLASYNAAAKFMPEALDVVYDFDRRAFYRGSQQVDRASLQGLARRAVGDGAGAGERYYAGSATTARVALVNSVVRATREGGWDGVLDNLVRQLSGAGLDPELRRILYAREPASWPRRGSTPEAIRAALVERFGERGISALEAAGTLRILPFSEAPQRLRNPQSVDRAVYDPRTGTAYLFSDRMTPAESVKFLLHEIGEHHGLADMLGNQAWATLKLRIGNFAKAKGSPVAAAWKHVVAEYPDETVGSDRFYHEVIARLGDMNEGRRTSVWRQIVTAIKAWAARVLGINTLTDTDIPALLEGSLRKAMRDAGAEVRPARQATEALSAAREDESDTERDLRREVWKRLSPADKEMVRGFSARLSAQPMGARPMDETPMGARINQTDTPEFKRWFGDSKVVDANGEPLVVYHGTPGAYNGRPITTFSKKAQGGLGGAIGFWFSDSREVGERFARPRYAGVQPEVIETYLSISNPKEYQTYRAFVDDANDRRGDSIEARLKSLRRALEKAGHDGIVIRESDTDGGVVRDDWVAFRPEQIKSAIGNRGTFDPNDGNIMAARPGNATISTDELRERLQNPDTWLQRLGKRVTDPGELFNGLDRSIHTMFHLAEKNPAFARVFNTLTKQANDSNRAALRPADMAPDVLPKIDTVRSLWEPLKAVWNGRQNSADVDAAFQAVLRGTLDDRLYTSPDDAGLTEKQFGFYRQFREAVDASLDELVSAESFRALASFFDRDTRNLLRERLVSDPSTADSMLREFMRDTLGDLKVRAEAAYDAAVAEIPRLAQDGFDGLDRSVLNTQQMGALRRAESERRLAADFVERQSTVESLLDRVRELKTQGYAPLMRFGQHYLDVVRTDPQTGEQEREFFGLFETSAERDAAARAFSEEYADSPSVTIDMGTTSEQAWKLYRGVSPESVALFAKELGLQDSSVYQEWYRKATHNRSAMKRLIQRKKIAGFSDDGSRVLASFLVSNGRRAGQLYHDGEVNDALSEEAWPRQQGAERDAAIEMKEYLDDPREEMAAPRALMFAHYLGGSVSNFFINATQPAMVTLPYLAKDVGVKKATSLIGRAYGFLRYPARIPNELKDALREAEQEGVVGANEVYHLWNETARPVVNALSNTAAGRFVADKFGNDRLQDVQYRVHAFMQWWATPFALAEHMNRHVTFSAAWLAAREGGKSAADAYEAAAKAVSATQFIYSRTNRPRWARGSIGSLIFTFKLFSISYMELLVRMARSGPEGQKAALVALGMLFAASGLAGLPGQDDLDDVVDTVMQLAGYNWNTKAEKRKFARAIAGEHLGDLALYGVSAVLPLDVQGRFGMGNLLPGTAVFKPSEDNKLASAFELFGPAGGLAKAYIDASDAVQMGNMGAALEAALPKALRDIKKAKTMWETGEYRDTRGRRVMDVSPLDALIKGMGFQPSSVAGESRAAGPLYEREALAKKVASRITEQWAQAIRDGKPGGYEEARRLVDEWNRRNPRTPIKSASEMRASAVRRAREMRATRADRLLKTVPEIRREEATSDLSE